MQLLVLSDIHGNLTALDAVLADAQRRFAPDAVALLGDSIDYGQRSNEVVARLAELRLPVACSVWGNHEDAIMNQRFDRFSSQRGAACAQHTAAQLSKEARAWIRRQADSAGQQEIGWDDRRILAVHGSIGDPLWGTIAPAMADFGAYKDYDMVLSGHSHVPHSFTAFVPDEGSPLRGKKAIRFLNPGSVGQPRNHDPRASYALWDTDEGIFLNAVPYDVAREQALFDGSIDAFYRDRLAVGV